MHSSLGVAAGAPGSASDLARQAYREAFRLAPVPALLLDSTRVVAANDLAVALIERSEITAPLLRELLLTGFRRPAGEEAPSIDAATMRFRAYFHRLQDPGRFMLCFLVPTCRDTPGDFYARSGLTIPERRVADHLLSGMTNRAIALRLGRSVETVRRHVARILRKCDVPNRTTFVARALSGVPFGYCRGIPPG